MYFLELLEKLDDMKEKPGFPPSLLSFFFFFWHLMFSLIKTLKMNAQLVELFLSFYPPPHMVTSFYNNKDSERLCQKVMCANTTLNDRKT